MKRHTDEEMVTEVLKWFDKAVYQAKYAFMKSDVNDLQHYHHSLGQDIRNHFKLWGYKWIPELNDGVDCSSEHPDAISMRVIQKVWKELHK